MSATKKNVKVSATVNLFKPNPKPMAVVEVWIVRDNETEAHYFFNEEEEAKTQVMRLAGKSIKVSKKWMPEHLLIWN